VADKVTNELLARIKKYEEDKLTLTKRLSELQDTKNDRMSLDKRGNDREKFE
jgi:hypothetical protein